MSDSEQKSVAAVIRFKVQGLLCFLSHQETARMFRRALKRSQIELKYSQGFNPHPKMSLPLPRSVGMAADCDLLQISIIANSQTPDANQILRQLAPHLPADINIEGVDIYAENTKFHPVKVTYFLPIENLSGFEQKLKACCERLNDSEPFVIERISHKTGKKKQLNLTEFVTKTELREDGVELTVKFIDGSTVKLDEMPELFGLESSQISEPIVRKFIEWQQK